MSTLEEFKSMLHQSLNAPTEVAEPAPMNEAGTLAGFNEGSENVAVPSNVASVPQYDDVIQNANDTDKKPWGFWLDDYDEQAKPYTVENVINEFQALNSGNPFQSAHGNKVSSNIFSTGEFSDEGTILRTTLGAEVDNPDFTMSASILLNRGDSKSIESIHVEPLSYSSGDVNELETFNAVETEVETEDTGTEDTEYADETEVVERSTVFMDEEKSILEQEVEQNEYPDFVRNAVLAGEVSEDIYKKVENDLIYAFALSKYTTLTSYDPFNLETRYQELIDVVYNLVDATFDSQTLSLEDFIMYCCVLDRESTYKLQDQIDFVQVLQDYVEEVPPYYVFVNSLWMQLLGCTVFEDVTASTMVMFYDCATTAAKSRAADILWYDLENTLPELEGATYLQKTDTIVVLKNSDNGYDSATMESRLRLLQRGNTDPNGVPVSLLSFARQCVQGTAPDADPFRCNLDQFVSHVSEATSDIPQSLIDYVEDISWTEIAEKDLVFAMLCNSTYLYNLLLVEQKFKQNLITLQRVTPRKLEGYNFYNFLFLYLAFSCKQKFKLLTKNMTELLDPDFNFVYLQGIPSTQGLKPEDFLQSLGTLDSYLIAAQSVELSISDGYPKIAIRD